MFVSDPGDVVVVPFPFTDIPVAKSRPALALSARRSNDGSGNTVFAMVTTAAHSHWPQDVPLSDHHAAGLSVASLIRMKLFTLDNRLVSRKIGQLSARDRQAVRQTLAALLTV